MTTYRKVGAYWTETKRIVGGEVKQTVCCCAAPGRRIDESMTQAGWRCRYQNRIKYDYTYSYKTPCRCDCHRGKTGEDA